MDFWMTDSIWMSVVGQLLIIQGAAVFATAALGLFRFPDVYMRSSSVATAAGLGIALIVAGAFFFMPGLETFIKVAVAVVLQLVTSAAGSMVIARAAYLTGSGVYSPQHFDELGDATPSNAEPRGDDRPKVSDMQ